MKAKKKKDLGGRPEVVFSDKDKREIQTLSGYGLSQEEIATLKNCDIKTLVKWCKTELEKGKAEAKSIVVNRLFRNIRENKENSIFFYLKTQCRWRETDKESENLENININIKIDD